MVSRKHVIFGVSLLVILSAGIAVRAYRSRAVTVEALSHSDSRQIWTMDRSPASGDWKRRYRFRREISATSGAKSILKFDLRGTLDLTRQGAWIRARFELEKAKGHPAVVSAIPFYFMMDGGGELTEIRSSGDADQQSILKDLALLFAYRTRLDTAGEVEMNLRDIETDGAAEVFKQKLQYLGQIGKLVKIKKSEHRIRKDLSLLAGIEVTEMGQIETLSKYQLKLERVESEVTEKINPDLVAQYAVVPLLHAERATVSGGRPAVSWKVLKEQLARIGRSNSAHRMKLFHEFIRTLRSDPKALSEFKGWMSSRRGEGHAGYRDFAYGVGVLSAVGSSAAQAELLSLYRDEVDPLILNAFTTMAASMTSETREFLKALTVSRVESESTPALLALGSSLRPKDGSHFFAASNVEDPDVIALILSRYRSAKAVSERMEVLDAIGNSGSEHFLPLLVSIVRDAQSPYLLVTKAIYAMRLMKSDEARGFLDRLSGDQAFVPYRGVILAALGNSTGTAAF